MFYNKMIEIPCRFSRNFLYCVFGRFSACGVQKHQKYLSKKHTQNLKKKATTHLRGRFCCCFFQRPLERAGKELEVGRAPSASAPAYWLSITKFITGL
jgi:hypothetical protein